MDSGIQESDLSSPKRIVAHKDFAAKDGQIVQREFEIDFDERCPCMDSLGYLPFGCNCDRDQLDVDTPADADIFGRPATNDHIVPKIKDQTVTVKLPAKDSNDSNDSNSQNQPPTLVAADNEPLVVDNLDLDVPRIVFPRILPESPPNRRVPPLFRWEVHVHQRPGDPPLMSSVERRMHFMDSIVAVPYDKDATGKDYKDRQDYEWRRLLGYVLILLKK